MGGLLMSLLDVVPTPGESAVYRGLKLTAQATDERRVRELLVEALSEALSSKRNIQGSPAPNIIQRYCDCGI